MSIEMHPRETEGGGEEEDFYYDYDYTGRGGNHRTSGFHEMTCVCEDEIKVELWVDERGEEVENEGLEIDHEHETLDGEKLYHREPHMNEVHKTK